METDGGHGGDEDEDASERGKAHFRKPTRQSEECHSHSAPSSQRDAPPPASSPRARIRFATALPPRDMPRIKVLYFARAREVTGGLADETHDLPDDECHTDALRLALVAKHPGLESVLRTAVFAVNQEYSDGRTRELERAGRGRGDTADKRRVTTLVDDLIVVDSVWFHFRRRPMARRSRRSARDERFRL